MTAPVSSLLCFGIGQAGARLCAEFFAQLAREHRIDPQTGSAPEGVTGVWELFFNRVGAGSKAERYVPRAIFLDPDPRTGENLRQEWPEWFNPASFAAARESSDNNFAIAYHERWEPLLDKLVPIFEKEAGKSPPIGGCLIFHALGGGTGSGIMARLLPWLKSRTRSAPVLLITALPSNLVSSAVTEPYNAVFGLQAMLASGSPSLLLPLDVIRENAVRHWNLPDPKTRDLNRNAASLTASITDPIRFPSVIDRPQTFAKLISDLAPNPDYPFLSGALVPTEALTRVKTDRPENVGEVLRRVLDDDLQLCPNAGGRLLSLNIYTQVRAAGPVFEDATRLVEGDSPLPHFVAMHLRKELPPQASLGIVVNGSETALLLKEILERFDKLWARKAFISFYLAAGFDENRFTTARREVGFRLQRYADL